jgi:integrase
MQSPISLSEAREAWLADAHFRRLSPRTIEEYERVSRHVIEHIGNSLGHEPALTDLTAASVRDWINQRPLRPASVAAYVRALRAFARWCQREYDVREPLRGLRPPQVVPTPVVLFSAAQLRALLEQASPLLAYAITLLAETGLRVSEAIALETDDIDGLWLRVRRGKGGRSRQVPVSTTLARATGVYLRQIRREWPQAQAQSRLLLNARGGPWTRHALRTALRRLGGRAGLNGMRVSPHTFRHQFAHDIAFNGGSLIALRDVLGHRSSEAP